MKSSLRISGITLIILVILPNCLGLTGVGTHFWDCNGGSCDSGTLQPWDPSKYRYAPQYAPQDPNDYGGAKYGEKIWMTGAPNIGLARLLEGDSNCCGSEDQFGDNCGQCMLVTVPSAVNADWKVLVMKKNSCPEWSNGCGANEIHLDLAAPGFDNLDFSTANICGERGTYISKSTSSVCGDWYNRGGNTIEACSCDSIPHDETAT